MPISFKYEYAFKCKHSSISNKENITKEYLELATNVFSNCNISNFPNKPKKGLDEVFQSCTRTKETDNPISFLEMVDRFFFMLHYGNDWQRQYLEYALVKTYWELYIEENSFSLPEPMSLHINTGNEATLLNVCQISASEHNNILFFDSWKAEPELITIPQEAFNIIDSYWFKNPAQLS